MILDIVCATYNGAEFVGDLLSSLRAQTHSDWRLWVHDDGSTDDTVSIVRSAAAADARIQPVDTGAPRLGATGSFARLLDHLPADSSYTLFADQDDVWLPHKIERTLAAMREAESASSVPVMVHTDLVVTDAKLAKVHESFWSFAGIAPEPATLRRLIVRNVATGAASMINRPLRELVGRIPKEAILHDWWCACVAAAFGHIVAVREPTILYRQHGSNLVGAREWDIAWSALPRAVIRGLEKSSEVRRGIELTAAQALAFLHIYESWLSEEDRRFLLAYSQIPARGFLRRKLDLLRYRRLPEHNVLRTLGILFRG